jgi:iron complex outermembrane receptor protein
MKTALLCGASAVALFTSAVSGQALAAEAAATASATATTTASEPTAIGELVVVAEKREERLQTTPVAISAYTSEKRELLGIKSLQDLTDFTPGLSYSTYDNRPYIRGIGRQSDNLAVDSGVANYIDGIYNGSNASTILQSDTLFVDRIEILRGPQSTLYGRNADGGSINFISKRPTKDWEAEIRSGYDSYGKWFGEGVMSGPITDWLRYRVGGNYTQQDGGYYKNLNGPREGGSVAQGGNGDGYHIEVQFEGNIGDKVDFWVKGATSDYNVSFHTQTLLGPLDTREFYNALFPNQNYGLCALPGGAANNPGCAATFSLAPAGNYGGTIDPIVSATALPNTITTNPSTRNLRDFDADFKSQSQEGKDAIVATSVTYHAPGFDIKYLFGFQQFSYNLAAPWLDFEGISSSVQSYALQGPTAATGLCTLIFDNAGCTQNLTVNPAHTQFTFDEWENFSSHELTFTSTSAGKLQWLVGFYYYHEYYEQPINVVDPSQAQVKNPVSIGVPPASFFGPVAANPSGSVYNEDTFLHEDSVAAYAQADWQFTPTLKFTGGIRYTNDLKVGRETFRVILFNASGFDLGVGTFGANTPAFDATACPAVQYLGTGPCTINPATGLANRPLEARWDDVSGTANLAWTPDSDTLVYGKYSRGFKSGAFNSGTLAAFPETQPETVDAIEVGLKKTVNREFQANLAAFYYFYSNYQQPLGVQGAAGVVSSQIFNIPDVRIYGVELETLWQPTSELAFDLNYSYLSATVSGTKGQCLEDTADPLALAPGANISGCPAPVGGIQLQNIVGQQIAEAPNNKVSFSLVYHHTFEPGTLTASTSLIWKDKQYSSPFNRAYNAAPAYSQVNLRLEFTDTNNRWSLIGYANNLFNTIGYDNVYGVPVTNPGANQVIDRLVSLTAPQTFGVEFQYRFK